GRVEEGSLAMTPVIQEKPQVAEQKKKEAVKGEPKDVKQKDQAAAETKETKAETVLSGIPGSQNGVTKIERNVPADEPPALAANDRLKHIGKRVPRQDGRFKVTGAAKYPSDIALPGMLYAKFVSATAAHARIVSIDTSAAEKHPDVKAVHVL